MREAEWKNLYPRPAPLAETAPAVSALRRAGRITTASWWSFGWVLIGATLVLGCPSRVEGSDRTRGAAIFQTECANCHGPDGLGGRAGEYPRLAGLPAGYLKLQLESFRDRKRQNKPMIPIFKAGRLRGDDIAAVAAHLAALPPPAPLQLGVPTGQDYDRELGEELYVAGCSLCHGLDGNGKPDTDYPPVTRQYPAYLVKQMRDFRAGQRWHEDAEALFQEAEPEELDALIAYMLELNHRPATAAAPEAMDPPESP